MCTVENKSKLFTAAFLKLWVATVSGFLVDICRQFFEFYRFLEMYVKLVLNILIKYIIMSRILNAIVLL